MAEPFTGAPSESTAKKEAELRRLVIAYKATFSTEKGRLVLADLKRRFGFDVCEADSELLSDNVIARRSFAKRPIFHIERMRNHNFRKEPKPKRALSDSHHEKPAVPSD